MKKVIRFTFLSIVFGLSSFFAIATDSYSVKAILFDMDGTIVDTEQFWVSVYFKMLEARNMPVTEEIKQEIAEHVLGNTASKIVMWFKERFELPESTEELLAEYRVTSAQHYEGNITFVPGFEEFFEKVREYPIRVAIASNCGPHSMGLVDKAMRLNERFGEHMYNPTHVERGKPAPDLYLHAAKQLEVEPHECFVIEDSPTGIKSAKAAGIFCIGLNRGDPELVKEADLIVNGYHEIDLEMLLQRVSAPISYAIA